LANTGVYVFSPAIFEHIPAGEFYDFGNQVFPSLQAAGEPFYGFDAQGAYWADIGTPREYRRASYDVVRGVLRIPLTTPNGIDPTASVADGVRIEGPVRIGAAVRVGPGASIVGPSILDDGVHVDAGALLERTICWENSAIGAGAELHDTVVGNKYAVEAGSVLSGVLVANDDQASPSGVH
jgi:mannose-1-phosphate guanylyltransferase